MKSVRRPAVALSATLALVLIQAVADPTGLLALVGWSGAQPRIDAGAWPLAPYAVFVPVLLAVVWWAAIRAGDRFWTLSPGVVLAVMLAQAAACLVMTGDVAIAAWAAGFVTAKAVPAALIIAALTRWFGGRPNDASASSPGDRSGFRRVVFAALAPLLAGLWWTGAVYAPGVPAARPDRDPLSLLVGMLLLAVACALCLRWMRARVPGVLGGWLAALVAGGLVGLVQAVVAFAVDGGVDRRPLAADERLHRARRRPVVRRLRRLDRGLSAVVASIAFAPAVRLGSCSSPRLGRRDRGERGPIVLPSTVASAASRRQCSSAAPSRGLPPCRRRLITDGEETRCCSAARTSTSSSTSSSRDPTSTRPGR